ncbi:ABC transporter permease [Actinocorallia longicatena]|uniref:ABC transporter permease n=1 Tax=Actinocorallia longicatena TaxID=111803 RepID=A0ABP6QGF7_9ACTN
MLSLALASLRHRRSAFTASFLAMLLGATMVMTFGSMLDTAVAPGVDSASSETLITMASVVGGWSLLLVAFAVSSTLALALRQRATEMALLKSVGATPGQLRRMVIGETLVVCLAGATAAIPFGWGLGHLLLNLLRSTDQVAEGVTHAFGPIALGQGYGITLLSSLAAALIASRRASRQRVTESLLEARAPVPARIGLVRGLCIAFFLAAGIAQAVLTATVMYGKGSDAMQTAGSADIWFAIGLSLFAPLLIRRVPAALPPIVLFIGIATGTLSMQDMDNRAAAAAGLVKTTEQRNIETLNLVVIAMIALFACIMLINTLIAATAHRSREFGQYRLIGATPGGLMARVARESLALTAVGAVLGTAAALVTILPYSYARTGEWTPDLNPFISPAVLVVAAVVTFTTTLATTRRVLRTPAIRAVFA